MIALVAVAISSCTETTDLMGNSLTSTVDQYEIITDTFDVSTRSLKVDSVLSKSVYSYIGRLKDPETGSYIVSDYMTQFHILENQSSRMFPEMDVIEEKGGSFIPVADSCFVRIVINSYQGDSLAAMKLVLHELAKPVEESGLYYTNFDPAKKGYLRDADVAINQPVVYSMTDLTTSDSLRNVYRTQGYYENVDIPLNDPYIAKDGYVYDNYGTYIMSMYYEHPEYFKNSKLFTRNVCPGFYLECVDGLGVMTEVAYTQLMIYYHYTINDTEYSSYTNINATEEVLQTTHITNDQSNIDKLVADNECTYLKTPAGIYTEVTLPIEQIKKGHENDTITSSRIVFSRMTEKGRYSDIVLEEPTQLLLVESDSIKAFFELNSVPNNKTSYLATFNSTYKTYTFNNITALINHKFNKVKPFITNEDGSINPEKLRLYDEGEAIKAKEGKPNNSNWRKAVLIPVQVETSATDNATTVSNEMNVNSVRLVGGSENKHEPVRISVIFNKNKG